MERRRGRGERGGGLTEETVQLLSRQSKSSSTLPPPRCALRLGDPQPAGRLHPRSGLCRRGRSLSRTGFSSSQSSSSSSSLHRHVLGWLSLLGLGAYRQPSPSAAAAGPAGCPPADPGTNEPTCPVLTAALVSRLLDRLALPWMLEAPSSSSSSRENEMVIRRRSRNPDRGRPAARRRPEGVDEARPSPRVAAGAEGESLFDVEGERGTTPAALAAFFTPAIYHSLVPCGAVRCGAVPCGPVRCNL